MRPGEIVVEQAARSFRVYPREPCAEGPDHRARSHSRAPCRGFARHLVQRGAGSAIGLVGRNGSARTTLRLLSGIIKPTSAGWRWGRIGSLLELGAGFHPDLTGRENVYLNGSIHGLGRVAIREKLDEIVTFAGLEDSIDLPVRVYSSGMYMRLGFAIAAHIEADVLLLDEVFAVGDEAFQRKCFGKIFEFKQRGGTIVFVSHDAAAVERLCDHAVLLKDGLVAFSGPTHEAIVEYRRLLAGEREPEERGAGLKEWGGVARVEACVPRLGRRRAHAVARRQPFAIAAMSSPRVDCTPAYVWGCATMRDLPLFSTAEARVGDTRTLSLRLDADRPPFSDGRLHLRVDLTDEDGQVQYHSLDDARVFVVYPADESRGLVRLEGRWSREDSPLAAELERA